jgi:cyclic pyranopterin phosphate synthase
MLCDGFQRKIEYLRLSVTDLCNLRCRYCMPLQGAVKRPREDILSFEEITRVVAAFIRLGVRSVRITGGEPLVRKDLPRLIGMLHQLKGLEEILLTTNGILLKDQAAALKASGLKRINIHLDTLDGCNFTQMTRWGNIQDVFAGIEAAKQAGLAPIKLNTVFMKGYNDWEVESMVLFAAERNLVVRFIELMPIGPGREMKGLFLPASTVRERLSQRWTLIPFAPRLGRGPAEYFKVIELNSVIGFIHPVSKPFCETCNRVRLSADGRLQDCLVYDESISLGKLLKQPGTTEDAIEQTIRRLITIKRPDHGGFSLTQCPATSGMYEIGG